MRLDLASRSLVQRPRKVPGEGHAQLRSQASTEHLSGKSSSWTTSPHLSDRLTISTPNLTGTRRASPFTPLVYLITKMATGLRGFLNARDSTVLSTREFPSVSFEHPSKQLCMPALLSTHGLDHCCSPLTSLSAVPSYALTPTSTQV